jgi:hypothetical protein
MRLHPRCVAVLMLLLVPATAHAHLHRWDVAAGPTYEKGSRLLGGRLSIGLTNRLKDDSDRKLSLLIDLTNLKDREDSQDTTLLSYFAGPRYSFGNDDHVVMLHGQLGIIDKHQGATGRTDLAFTAGVAYEFIWGGAPAGVALRLQVEHSFVPDKDVKGRNRYSAAVVKRFE